MQRIGSDVDHERMAAAQVAGQPPEGPLTLTERVERALVLLAYFIELDGDVHIPMYERLEAELAELKRKEDTRSRARRLIAGYGKARPGPALLAGAPLSSRAEERSECETPERDR